MNPFIANHKNEFNSSIEHFQAELTRIRSGQANPELVEGVMVSAYDNLSSIKHLATITAPDPKTLVIQPWDKSILKQIEAAIVNADMGFSPLNDGNVIRISMPPMTEENRTELSKIVNQKAEKYRVSLRQIRDKVKEEIIKAEQNKEIGEDEKFKYLKDLDQYTNEQTEGLNKIANHKKQLIMSV